MYDISKTYDFEFEEVTPYTIEVVQEYWDYMFLGAISFNPSVAYEEEIEVSKFVAVDLVKYIF